MEKRYKNSGRRESSLETVNATYSMSRTFFDIKVPYKRFFRFRVSSSGWPVLPLIFTVGREDGSNESKATITFRNKAPSIVPVVPKLQHEPHTAWSFTGVTAPEINNQG